jgi:hypothetical protein
MINVEKTKRFFGYNIHDASSTSKPVVANCDECSSEMIYSSLEYCHRKLKRDGKIKCQLCGHSHRRGQEDKKAPKETLPPAPLPPEVDIEMTAATYGYNPVDLPPWSRKKLVVRCSVLQNFHHVQRCTLNRFKSVLETGHYISVGGFTKLRRAGTKVSLETREKMRKSQAMRRLIEEQAREEAA